MKGVGYPDWLEVINGPEDGTVFPIARTPVDAGADPACGVHLRLDGSIRPTNARLTVVSDGYRVRALDRQPVYADGKRVGLVRSRILRNESTLQIGNTRLALTCSTGGLAQRSHGLPTESDAWWLLSIAVKSSFRGLHAILALFTFLFGRSFRYLIPALVLLGLLGAFVPSIRQWLVYGAEYAYFLLWRLINMISG